VFEDGTSIRLYLQGEEITGDSGKLLKRNFMTYIISCFWEIILKKNKCGRNVVCMTGLKITYKI
jgi:hypothetical protein